MKIQTDWAALIGEVDKDRRREKRIPLVFPIEVCGFDRKSQFFAERTVTTNISSTGCSFKTRAEVEAKAIVAIKLLETANRPTFTDRPFLFQVAWVKKEEDRWVYGAAKLQTENIWCLDFPQKKEQGTTSA